MTRKRGCGKGSRLKKKTLCKSSDDDHSVEHTDVTVSYRAGILKREVKFVREAFTKTLY